MCYIIFVRVAEQKWKGEPMRELIYRDEAIKVIKDNEKKRNTLKVGDRVGQRSLLY